MSQNEIDALLEENNAELEALQRDIAERQRRARSEQNLAWCKARNAERPEAERQAQATPPRNHRSTEAEPMTQPTDAWVAYIKQQLDKRERVMTGAIADVIAPIEKKHKAALDELRSEVATLKGQLAELHAEAKLRGSLDDVQARLDRIEQRTNKAAPLWPRAVNA